MAYREHDSRRKFGVEGGPFTGDRVVDLTKLPAGARAALLARIHSRRPMPILSATRQLDRAVLLGLFAAGVLAAAHLAQDHFGDLAGPSQLEARWALAYVALGALAFLCLGLFVRSVLREGLFRFPQGTVLYPLDLLVIDGMRMRVRSFGDARYVDAKKNAIEIEYANGDKVRVPGRRHSKASLLAEMLAAQHDLEDATALGRSTKDVLADLRAHFPWSELAPSGAEPGRRLVVVAAIAALGAAIGAGTWAVRAPLEDDAMFESALAKNDVAAYRAYLARGKRHAAEAHDDEADAARRSTADDVLPLTRMIATYPGTPAVARAQKQLRDACARYASDGYRDRCAPSEEPGAVCVPLEQETICADEVREADLARVIHSTDLRSIFAARDGAIRERRSVAEMDARIDTLVQEANAEICAVGAPHEEILALHELARSQRRIPLLGIQFEGGDVAGKQVSTLRVLFRHLRDGALDVTFETAPLAPPDRTWVVRIHPESLELVSGTTTTRGSIAPKITPPDLDAVFPGMNGYLHALEALGFRPNGPPRRCFVPRVGSLRTDREVTIPRPVPTDG